MKPLQRGKLKLLSVRKMSTRNHSGRSRSDVFLLPREPSGLMPLRRAASFFWSLEGRFSLSSTSKLPRRLPFLEGFVASCAFLFGNRRQLHLDLRFCFLEHPTMIDW